MKDKIENAVKNNEINVHNREYKFDNIKFILIFLVVFGHVIENTMKLHKIYLIIYSFHMPVFAFVSGYFSKGRKKSIIKPLCIYMVAQTIYFGIYKYILHQNITLDYLTPMYILWYLFALAIWNSMAFILKRIHIKKKLYAYIIIVLAFIISMLCGYIDSIGPYLALSRTITFFPFFLLGYFYKNNFNKIKESSNPISAIFFIIIAELCIVQFIRRQFYNRELFYAACSYRNGGYNIFSKIGLSLIGLYVIFIFLKFVSSKKTIISDIGKNTLYIFLIHGIIVMIFNPYIDFILNLGNKRSSIFIAIIFTSVLIIRC